MIKMKMTIILLSDHRQTTTRNRTGRPHKKEERKKENQRNDERAMTRGY